MGNRAVITTAANFKNNGIGVYLHWNGGRDSVEAFLKYCELKGYIPEDGTGYGLVRMCQVIGNYFGGKNSLGIGTVKQLDCDNGDNGTYIIDGRKIIGRRYAPAREQRQHDLREMLEAIDEAQPEAERLGKDFLRARKIPPRTEVA